MTGVILVILACLAAATAHHAWFDSAHLATLPLHPVATRAALEPALQVQAVTAMLNA